LIDSLIDYVMMNLLAVKAVFATFSLYRISFGRLNTRSSSCWMLMRRFLKLIGIV